MLSWMLPTQKNVRLCINRLKLAFVSEIPQEIALPNPKPRWYNIAQRVDVSMLSWDEVSQLLQEMCKPSSATVRLAYKYIELAAHQYPGIQICQIASGSEEETQQIINHALDSHHLGEMMCGRYIFAHSVHKSVELAKHNFSAYGAKMDFHVFDPVCDSASERLEANDLDIVILLGNYWTRETLRRALGNLRQVLKPGGKLIL
jgi:hypothetical protein